MGDLAIEVSSRLHLGLISMHAGGPRRNGGIGFAVQRPTCLARFAPASDIFCNDLRPDGLAAAEREHLVFMLEGLRRDFGLATGMVVTLSGGMSSHRGFGSGTAIRLACIEGLFALNDWIVGSEELVLLSKRGGTSGIGITTYFRGGLVLDAGVASSGDEGFLPSSAVEIVRLPLTLGRVDMPDWMVGICRPHDIPPKSQEEELEFFLRTTPLRREASYEAAYHAVFGAYAAALEADFVAFCSAIDALQNTDWKKAERMEYGQRLSDLDTALRDRGALAVGMSSLGPTLFFLGTPDTMARISDDAGRLNSEITITTPSNIGRKLSQ